MFSEWPGACSLKSSHQHQTNQTQAVSGHEHVLLSLVMLMLSHEGTTEPQHDTSRFQQGQAKPQDGHEGSAQSLMPDPHLNANKVAMKCIDM